MRLWRDHLCQIQPQNEVNRRGSLTRPNKMLCSLSELLQSVKTSVTPPNNELSDNESLKHPLNLALTCSTSWRDVCVCVALCHGNKKKKQWYSHPDPHPICPPLGGREGICNPMPFTLTCWAGSSGDSRLDVRALIKVLIAFHRILGRRGGAQDMRKIPYGGQVRWVLKVDADICRMKMPIVNILHHCISTVQKASSRNWNIGLENPLK